MTQVFIALHMLTCSMIAVCTYRDFNISWLGRLQAGEDEKIGKMSSYRIYIASLYFVMTTLSTCGFGDICGVSSREANPPYTFEKVYYEN